jgi:maltooligosyltrehalose trehalohydrolase
MSLNVSKRTIGINFENDDNATVVLWAPLAKEAEIVLAGSTIPLEKQQYGYWKTTTNKIKPGDRYKFSLDKKPPLPDPASLWQPDGVHEQSAAFDVKNYEWSDASWKNIPLSDYIIYELHTGTFSDKHNFSGIIEKLDYLADLGITAIEIMPVGQFPGKRNWGYDGVYPFAVQHSYGGPAGLQKLVDACHQKGIAVILDVIYNHLGPEGNYLGEYGPYFTDKYKTPWGKAMNYDDAWCNGARDFVIDNALMWFRDFHVDALRMDAVHAIRDFGAVHLLKAMKQKVDELSAAIKKPCYLIAELDLNDPVFINPLEKNGYGADAQWIDEFHHALRVTSGQPREGYYADFNGIADLAKSYRDVYVYDGQFSNHRKKFFGAKTDKPGSQFVVFSQNHDHIGNRMLGERTSKLVSFEMCKLLAAAVLFSPYLPMLFMGEEWAESNPFLFFIDHTDAELAKLVAKGRKEEFSSFNWKGEAPDPRLEETFNQSQLQWHLTNRPPHQTMLRYYKKLIALRKTIAALKSTNRNDSNVEVNVENNTLVLRRSAGEQLASCAMNFSKQQQILNVDGAGMRVALDSSSTEWGGPSAKSALAEKDKIKLQPESIVLLV